MDIIFNGRKTPVPEGASRLDQMLRSTFPDSTGIIVLHNSRVVPADRHSAVRLSQNDRVDCIQLTGGG